MMNTKIRAAMAVRTRELTTREQKIAQLYAEGYKTSEISDQLFRSCSTIEAHKIAIWRKLNITNNRQWMSYLRTYAIPRLTFPIETKPAADDAQHV